MPTEFDIIRQLAAKQSVIRDEVSLGIGDDAALLNIPEGHELVVSTDTLNQGVHFPEETSAADIGYKVLAVSLSDLAAMGAEPLAVNLSLSILEADAGWLKDFAEGFLSLARIHNVQLCGGDTTRGPMSISATIFGMVPTDEGIKRSTARTGDSIYVTGSLGDAGIALLGKLGELKLTGPQQQYVDARLNRPQPRVPAGLALRGIASSCIDISDGLTSDLGHILEQSGLGATLYVDQLPLSDCYREVFELAGGWIAALGSGDDYELCFTIDDHQHADMLDAFATLDVPVSCVGMVENTPGLRLQMPDGSIETADASGYEHFR